MVTKSVLDQGLGLGGFLKRRMKGRKAERAGWASMEPLEPRAMMAASPLGTEVMVNEASSFKQQFPSIASAANGDFIVVYRSQVESDLATEIQARLYNANGSPKSAPFVVNSNVPAGAGAPGVAADASGDFVVVWENNTDNNTDVYARIYSADGTPVATEFRVNSVTTGVQRSPAVAMDDDGDFVVGWLESNHIAARQFSIDGTPDAGQFKVSDSVVSGKDVIEFGTPSVGMDSDGDFVVGWAERKFTYITKYFKYPPEYLDPYGYGPKGYDADVPKLLSESALVKRYNASGVQQGSLITAFTTNKTGSHVNAVEVAMDSSGDFVVGYQLDLYTLKVDRLAPADAYQVPTGGELWTRRYPASGNPAAAVKAAAVAVPIALSGFGVDINHAGAVTVAWATQTDPDAASTATTVQAIRYDISSKADGPAFNLSSVLDTPFANPAVCLLDSGNIIFGFESAPLGDADVYVRAFEPPKANLGASFGDIKVGTATVFGNTLIPGDKVTIATRVTNGPNSALALNTTTNIAFYASSDTNFGEDILLGTLTNQKLALAVGATATYTFNWTVGSTTPPGSYRLYAKVDVNNTTVETSEQDNVADSGTNVTVGWSFGNLGGRNAKLVLNDADGTAITYSLTGNGSGSVDAEGNVTLNNVDANTAVTVAAVKSKTLGDNGTSNLGNVTVNGSLKSFTAKTSNLTGDFSVTGTLAALTLKNAGTAGTQHTLTINDNNNANTPSVFTLVDVNDLNIISHAPIKTLTANSWNDTNAGVSADLIMADYLDTVTTKGAFNVSLNLAGTSLPKPTANTLNKVTVGGGVAANNWNVSGLVGTVSIKGIATLSLLATGNVASVTVGQLLNARIFAGVSADVTSLPITSEAFTSSRTLGNLTISGIKNESFSFINSLVAAQTITKITLKQVKTDSGSGAGTIGVAADVLKSYKRDTVSLSTAALANAGDYDVNNTFKVQVV